MEEELTEIGRYKIVRFLGSGTFANVYLAIDSQLQREVAIKVLKAGYKGDEEIYNRFQVEALSAANLWHPHIAWVWDLGEKDGLYYITIRFIAGNSLDKVVKEKGSIHWTQAVKYAVETGEALAFAHSKNIIHRDVKPQNIMISPVDGAVLTDFGLAKAMVYNVLQTRSGGIVGTPQYVPAEVWNGETATQAVDQYALACVLAEMLTGKILFQASTLEAIVMKHFAGPTEAWYPLPPETPPGLEKILRKALSPKPADRYASVNDFIQSLSGFKAPADFRDQRPQRTEPKNQQISNPREAVTPQEPVRKAIEPEPLTGPSKTPSDNRASNVFDLSRRNDASKTKRKLYLGNSTSAKSVNLTKRETSMGRLDENDVRFNDPEVSRRHAIIHNINGAMFIEDLNSANGTYLNNVRTKGRTEIKSGDHIRLGKTVELLYREE